MLYKSREFEIINRESGETIRFRESLDQIGRGGNMESDPDST